MKKFLLIVLLSVFCNFAFAAEQENRKEDNKFLFSFSSEVFSLAYVKTTQTIKNPIPGTGTVELKSEEDVVHFAINPTAWDMFFGYKVIPNFYIIGKFGFDINSEKIWGSGGDRADTYKFILGPGVRYDINMDPLVFYAGGTICYSMTSVKDSNTLHLGVIEGFGGLEAHINEHFSLGGKAYLQWFFGTNNEDQHASEYDPSIIGVEAGLAFSASVYF